MSKAKRRGIIIIALAVIVVLAGAYYAYRKISDENLLRIQKNLFGVEWPMHSIWLHNNPVDEITAFLGEPRETITNAGDPDRIYLQYDGFQVLCGRPRYGGEFGFGSVVITDPSFELWRGHIRIGSTRKEVEDAFRGFKYELEDYKDLYWWVGVRYDENDRVKAIYLS